MCWELIERFGFGEFRGLTLDQVVSEILLSVLSLHDAYVGKNFTNMEKSLRKIVALSLIALEKLNSLKTD